MSTSNWQRSLRKQFELKMFTLQHYHPLQFYTSCWQTSYACFPIIVWKGFLFLVSLGILLASFNGLFKIWFIYISHWGIVLVTLTTGLSFIISARYYFEKTIEIDVIYALPLYIKTYWVLYNVTIPLSFTITVLYHTLLRGELNENKEQYWSYVVNALVHNMNSVIMAIELLTAAHPSRLLHFYQPLCCAFIYVIFGVIYHLSGGTDRFGRYFIYPLFDWHYPGQACLVSLVVAVFLLFMHLVVVLIAAGRNRLAKKIKAQEEQPPVVFYK